MRHRKHERAQKRQRGQFMTPRNLASRIVESLHPERCGRVLEPSCGDGVFIDALLEAFANAPASARCPYPRKLVGIEIDSCLADAAQKMIATHAKALHSTDVEIINADFFDLYLDRAFAKQGGGLPESLDAKFDLIVGNPPFGGTFNHAIEDRLDAELGSRLGKKIKKETYAFFIVASIELLRDGGRMVFVCSDTLMTIPTMTGLRQYLMETGSVEIHEVREFSSETNYPMVVIDYQKGRDQGVVRHGGDIIPHASIRSTPNLSWGITKKLSVLFDGPSLGDYFIASSGMTTGKNEYFVREIAPDGSILEPYAFEYYDAPVTVAYELERARLGRLPPKRRRWLEEAEMRGDTERRLRVTARESPECIQLPDVRYKPYNKANGSIIYSPPRHAIFWENDGEAVLTFKKTGNWYLRGVGGQPYFGREGLTWQLVASRFYARHLPPGYILDSGAPCAFPRDGVNTEELYFTIAWLLAPLANHVLKQVINHTRNIQSKDFERMPYPWWVSSATKRSVIEKTKRMIELAREGKRWTWKDGEVRNLGVAFELPDDIGSRTELSALRFATGTNLSAASSLFDCLPQCHGIDDNH